jgi:hypothetical protein
MWLKATYEKFSILGLVPTFTGILPALVLELLCPEPRSSPSASRGSCPHSVSDILKKPVFRHVCVHSDVYIVTDILLHQLYHVPCGSHMQNMCWYMPHFSMLEVIRITHLSNKTERHQQRLKTGSESNGHSGTSKLHYY